MKTKTIEVDSDLIHNSSKTKEVIETYLKDNFPQQIKVEQENATYIESLGNYISDCISKKENLLDNILTNLQNSKTVVTPSQLEEANIEAFNQSWTQTKILIDSHYKMS